jgi:precorrin-4/cobalt-precorrin-4 C11-methyltransferase
MVIFLGVQQIRKLCKELIEGGYPKTTPIAVLHKVSWPEETIIKGTISDMASKVEKSKISKTALVIVGRVLAKSEYSRSKLYDPLFTHGHRKGGTVVQCSKEESQ